MYDQDNNGHIILIILFSMKALHLYDHLVLDENDAIRKEGEENGDDTHESPEFQVGHFWKLKSVEENDCNIFLTSTYGFVQPSSLMFGYDDIVCKHW